jgi:hypothetical protein
LHEVRRAFFLDPPHIFMMESLQKFRRKFFRTPLLPLEVFAENEKYPIIWKKYKEKVQKKSIF